MFQTWLNSFAAHDGTGMECAPLSDRDILAALYDATGGPNWDNGENWLTDRPPGEWHGVGVDDHGRVISLTLRENGLRDEIPPELGALANLTSLDLSLNNLTGPIPPELGALSNLRGLYLSFNNLTGAIPPQLGALVNLRRLNLPVNNLTGPIPPEFSALTNLKTLWLPGNNLTSPIPPEIGELANLTTLGLSGNHLTGSIPPGTGRAGESTQTVPVKQRRNVGSAAPPPDGSPPAREAHGR